MNESINHFEALEWAWLVSRYSETKDEAEDYIQEMLFELGNGLKVDFAGRIKVIREAKHL